METRRGVQNCRARDTVHTSESQPNETMDDNAGSNEQQNDIMNESADSSEPQYASMDEANTDESNAGINISETTAVAKDV